LKVIEGAGRERAVRALAGVVTGLGNRRRRGHTLGIGGSGGSRYFDLQPAAAEQDRQAQQAAPIGRILTRRIVLGQRCRIT
jgi:hypothetical protein